MHGTHQISFNSNEYVRVTSLKENKATINKLLLLSVVNRNDASSNFIHFLKILITEIDMYNIKTNNVN